MCTYVPTLDLLSCLEKQNSNLSHGFPIKALDFGKLYQDDLGGTGMRNDAPCNLE